MRRKYHVSANQEMTLPKRTPIEYEQRVFLTQEVNVKREMPEKKMVTLN